MDTTVYIVGDIHGQLERLTELLRAEGLISSDGAWTGGGAHLWLMGDFLDRGPHGIEALDFVMRLQQEAIEAGGQVDSLLGNHDLLTLGALRFRGLFLINHQRNGGDVNDLKRMTTDHAKWLAARPAMARIGFNLLAHADTDAYLRYGRTVTQVNRRINQLLAAPDEHEWDALLEAISERHAFDETTDRGSQRIVPFLVTFGAKRLIHGHTPISYVSGQPASEISQPWIYCQERCVNVDAGLYMGAPGFVFQIEQAIPASRPLRPR